jgi:hypothetical protein
MQLAPRFADAWVARRAFRRTYDSEEGQLLIWEDVGRFLAYDRSAKLTTHE